MQVDIFHRMFEFYTTSYTHFENRAEDILIYLEEMGDCVKKEIIQEDTLYTQECDMYHFESKFARQCQERIVSAKYSCGFSNLLDSSIIVNER